MAHILHSYPNNPRAWKALVAAKYVGIKIDVPAFEVGVSNKTPEFLAKNPLGKVPVLDTPHGSLFESNAIARYVARQGSNNIYGRNAYEVGQVEQWLEYERSEMELPAVVWLYPIFGLIANNPAATAKAQQDIKKALAILDDHLSTRTYLVGNSVTLADIVLATHLVPLYRTVLEPEFRAPFVNTNRWFNTVVNQPNFKEVLGEVELCTQMKVAAAPQKKEKEVKPKAEAKPKEEAKPKKEEAKPKKQDDDEEEEENFEDDEPKGKNPLDLLPKSAFVMDEWKRVYSNQDTRSQAIPWFWANLDKSGYCMYFCDYKYNDELEKVFMTNNLIGGFFQRLEKLHKYAFGSLAILGTEPKLAVHGVWLFRGNEIPKEMKDCDDSEHYHWTQVNTDDAGQKKLVEDYFAWESNDSFNGKGAFNAGKVYK